MKSYEERMEETRKYWFRCEVRRYCMEKHLFYGGSTSQWEKMLKLENLHDIAVAIWLCSDGITLEEIEKDLKEMEENA